MSNMKNAPLIYTVGMVGFPAIPNFERFPALFHEAVRGEYPLPEEFVLRQFSAQLDASSVRLEQSETKSWQYAAIDGDWAFVLSERALCLHTVNYHDFEDFARRFRLGLEALLAVPEIKIAWVTDLGFRYVNLVVPPSGEHLEQYIQAWALPTHLPDASLSLEEGVHIARYRTAVGNLRFQALRNPPFTMPPDLTTPMTIKNEWIRPRPQGELAVIDIDHAARVEKALPADTDALMDKLGELRGVARQVFDSVGTTAALDHWRGTHVSA